MNHSNQSLLNRLIAYNKTRVPMHMPGHKRNTELLRTPLPYDIDITEIHGFDNLHDMRGILRETASLAADIYGSAEAIPLIGGSSCGILAAVHALVPHGAHVLAARNCHSSVYHAIELMGLHPHYLCPPADDFGICGKITPDSVLCALQIHKDISLVILTSPTYEGVVSDVSGIAAVCRKFGVRLLVDSAHGAHFGFSPGFPKSAVPAGADIVVMSLHKTMPSLTQTALLHVCSDSVNKNRVYESLSFFETSSPSYVLLASIDECLRFVQRHQTQLFAELLQNLSLFYKKAEGLKSLSVLKYDDPSKIVVSTKNTALAGGDLAEILRKKYKIEIEMAGPDFVLAITSICDTKEHILLLADALTQIDQKLAPANQTLPHQEIVIPQMQDPPLAARQKAGCFCSFTESVNRQCLEYIWAYPPGIPLIVPGEILSEKVLAKIESYIRAKVDIKSTNGCLPEKIWVAEK